MGFEVGPEVGGGEEEEVGGITGVLVCVAAQFGYGSMIEVEGCFDVEGATERIEGHEGVKEGLEEKALRGGGKARAVDGVGVETEVAEDVGEVGGEVNVECGVGAKVAVGEGRGGRPCCPGGGGIMAVEKLAGHGASADCLGCFVPGCALEKWWGCVRRSIDEADAAFGGVNAQFADSGHHGSLMEVVAEMGEKVRHGW